VDSLLIAPEGSESAHSFCKEPGTALLQILADDEYRLSLANPVDDKTTSLFLGAMFKKYATKFD